MSILTILSTLTLRPLLTNGSFSAGTGESSSQAAVRFLLERFTDQSQRLSKALSRASERAWRALELALAGETLWSWIDPADDRAFRQQVRLFLEATPLEGLSSHGVEFRQVCVRELRTARNEGLLGRGSTEPADLSGRVADFTRFADPTALLQAEWKSLDDLAEEVLRAGYPTLAHFLKLRPATGLPLLLLAVRYFFRRQVESDDVLARSLAFAKMERLAETQEAAFSQLDSALTHHGRRLDEVLTVAFDIRAGVFDIQAELSRQGQQIQDLGHAVLTALRQHQLERRELRPHDSLSLRSEPERQLVRQLVSRCRALPEADRRDVPALLNALGKLQMLAGDFEGAQRDFQESATATSANTAKAEAHYHAYRAALERRRWEEALIEFRQAVQLDPARFAAFPLDRLEPLRILGAGGFGVVFLCRHRFLNAPVVIKALLADDLDRDVDQVFAEAQTLLQVSHAAVIRVTDCAYADNQNKRRPYLAMDYFDSVSLDEHVRQHGPLSPTDLLEVAWQMAEGLHAAHGKNILHRDVKPANVLIRREAVTWQIKLIDFGLAVRKQAIQNTISNADALGRTLAGSSIAGTLDYAAPEQMGKLPGVVVGPPADVYGWARTCCYALFQTPSPRRQHWQQIAGPLADLLDSCLAERPADRPATMLIVLDRLADIRPSTAPVLVKEPVAPVVIPPPPVEVLAPATDFSPLVSREKLAQTLVSLHQVTGVANKILLASTLVVGISLLLTVLFWVQFVTIGDHRDSTVFLVLGCVSAGIAIVPGSILFAIYYYLRKRLSLGWTMVKRLARRIGEEYPAAVPLGVDMVRWDHQSGWDLVQYLDDHQLKKGVQANITFAGGWFTQTTFKVYLDGRLLGSGHTKTGFSFRVNLVVGTHQLLIKWDQAQQNIVEVRSRVELSREGQCAVECKIPQQQQLFVEVHYA
jgi:tetratricopeptide (TPR) repeat protein